MSTAAAGMQAASLRMETAATNIAKMSSGDAPPADTDVAQQVVNLVTAKVSFMANAVVFQVSSDMAKRLYELGDDHHR